MRKLKIIVGVMSLLLLLQFTLVAPVSGITNGDPDQGNHYPYVGIIAIDFLDGQGLHLGCSGTLIAPDVFLTAGHCLFWWYNSSNREMYVSFDNYMKNSSGEGNNWIKIKEVSRHPLYGHDLGNLYDLAVLFLTVPVNLPLPTLTTADYLDDLSAHGGLRGVDFTSVGYGVQADWERGPVVFSRDGWRNIARAPLMALTPPVIFLNINEHATGGGGACFGDSGGPVFLPTKEGEILVGVTTYLSDRNCRAMTTYYRIDTPWAQDFLRPYIK